ncbi:hypothetical protein [Aquincola sp. J276]|nr:hypothetical protein [Aquincola sp. J276]MCR5867041.1 hypothetical protein [Aquincola sp. J276]
MASAMCCWSTRSARRLQPLLDELLLVPDPATRAFRQKVGVEALRLEEVL